MKTKAVIFPKADTFEFTELTLPEPGPTDVLLRSMVTAISPGTERWILRGKHLGTKFPCVPGYHRISVVEHCGKDVSGLQVGDLVYGGGGRWQESHIASMFGAHTSHAVADWRSLDFIDSTMPSTLDLECMAFTIVAAVANRGIRFCEVHSHQKILIIGAGFIGICAAQLANLRGAQAVLVEKDPERAAWVNGIIGPVFCTDNERLEADLHDFAPAGFDLIYDTAGHAPTTDAMVKLARPQGKLLLQAQYFDKEKCAIDLDQIKIRELTCKTTCGIDKQDWADTITNIRQRRLRIAPLITHRFDADDALKGYELLLTGKPLNMGIVFHWNKPW